MGSTIAIATSAALPSRRACRPARGSSASALVTTALATTAYSPTPTVTPAALAASPTAAAPGAALATALAAATDATASLATAAHTPAVAGVALPRPPRPTVRVRRDDRATSRSDHRRL